MKLLLAASVVLVLALLLGYGAGDLTAAPTTAPASAPSTQPTPVNTKCPVTKDPVDPKVPTVQYKGKTIGFCCDDCIKEFKANPEKYMANLK